MAADYQRQLRRQLAFINTSSGAYDAGDLDEAIRIATALRVIFHQTTQSTSLLTHLNARGVRLRTETAESKPTDTPPVFHDGMSIIGPGGVQPKLGRGRYAKDIPFADWWTQSVVIFGSGPVTRRDIVLAAANKDGGAHVDSTLPQAYKALVSGIYTDAKTDAPLENQHGVCLRQIGHEVLHSPELLRLAGL